MKVIINDDKKLQFAVIDDQAAMLTGIKAAGVKMGPTSLQQLLGGEREIVMGFRVAEVDEVDPNHEGDKPVGQGEGDKAGAEGSQDTAGADNQGNQGNGEATRSNSQNGSGTDDANQDNAGDQGNQDNAGNDNQGDGQGQGGGEDGGGEDNNQGGAGSGDGPKNQGFQNMDPEMQREIAKKGGENSHGTAGQPKGPEPVPGNQGGTTEQHQKAGAQSHKNTNAKDGGEGDQGGNNQDNQGGSGGDEDKPQTNDNQGAQAAAPKPASGGRGKSIKNADPKGKIKPVRKGTKIANGLELMLKGCTIQQLEDEEVSDDVYDFVNRRVTKRGYGVKMDGDTITLVIPEGTKGIQYGAGGGGDAEENAPADKPIEEVKEEEGQQGGDAQTGGDDDKPEAKE